MDEKKRPGEYQFVRVRFELNERESYNPTSLSGTEFIITEAHASSEDT